MGDEKDNWKVKTLDEILQEKKRRKEQEEKAELKHNKNADDRDSKRDSLEEGELRDQRMEITIRNSPYRREDSMEDRGEEDDSLAIKPPQQISRKEKSHHRKDEKRKEKRRHRSHSAEGPGGKHIRGKEKEREHERRKRHREEQDKVRREWERQKRREMAREHSRRERDRLEQIERKRERERKIREQQKEQRELKERERRAEERRKERDLKREGLAGSALPMRRKPGLLQESEKMQYNAHFADARILVEFSTQTAAHHRMAREEHGEKTKENSRSRSPLRQQRDRLGPGDGKKQVKEDRIDQRSIFSDLQDVSDFERKTTSAESSSAGSASASEDEEETSSEESEDGEEEEDDDEEEDEEEEEEEEETGSNSEAVSDQTAEEVSDEEMSEEEEREKNGNHIPIVSESRFDHDSAESEEEEEDEEDIREISPHSNAPTDGEYVPDSPVKSPAEEKEELPKYLPALQGCRSVEEFQCLNRIEEGTYGVVYRAKDKKTDEIVALKRLKMEKEKEGFPITSLREINTILKAQHPNIVTVREIVVGSNMDKIYIVMNYVEHDLKSLMETMKQPFLPGEVRLLFNILL
ncbi:hypothetical protein GDO86_012668 [Hymenochirus boettgeri]|uniref:cyclin-dependent kinase n=1 Tax=Hymenochirus boettgeri TaxID=247094 RepID=A0A8T2ITI9_9PIPI|nr:hypothetical protein GDO86_012668 [Hymenochirus boettgeri]KAG8434374.1 hypothetical protein GDO86_012668 [Hymenochirus boettgeri]